MTRKPKILIENLIALLRELGSMWNTVKILLKAILFSVSPINHLKREKWYSGKHSK